MSKTIDKSLTKKLLDDVIVKDEPEVDEYKSTYPEPSYVEGGRSWMDDCDLGLGFVGLGKDYTSARAVVDGNRSGGKVIELDRHDTDEIIRLLAKKMENVLQKEGFVMTPDSRDELENSLLAVVDLCKWKSETSLYVLKLR
jgi:hypothetical protein